MIALSGVTVWDVPSLYRKISSYDTGSVFSPLPSFPPKRALVRVVVLRFKEAGSTEGLIMPELLITALENIRDRSSLDIEVYYDSIFTYDRELTDSMQAELMRTHDADVLIWGSHAMTENKDFYILRYSTLYWPEMSFNTRKYVPLSLERFSSGQIDGNLEFVLRYLQGILNYQWVDIISETKPDAEDSMVNNNIKSALSIFLELKDDSLRGRRIPDSIYFFIGNCYFILRDLPQAKNYYKQYIIRKPQNADAFANIAHVYYLEGNLNRAIAYIDSAIYKYPGKLAFYNNRQLYLFESELYERTIEDVKRLVFYKPVRADCLQKIVTCYMLLGNPKAALPYADTLLMEVNTSDAYAQLAHIYCLLENWEKSRFYSDEALRRDSSIVIAYNAGIKANMKLKCYPEVIAYANQIMIRDPKNIDAYVMRGLALFYIGELTAAVIDISYAIHLDSTRPDLFHSRAMVYDKMLDETRRNKDLIMEKKLSK